MLSNKVPLLKFWLLRICNSASEGYFITIFFLIFRLKNVSLLVLLTLADMSNRQRGSRDAASEAVSLLYHLRSQKTTVFLYMPAQKRHRLHLPEQTIPVKEKYHNRWRRWLAEKWRLRKITQPSSLRTFIELIFHVHVVDPCYMYVSTVLHTPWGGEANVSGCRCLVPVDSCLLPERSDGGGDLDVLAPLQPLLALY